ncbi:MAG: response regulator transcription factor [Kiritimatiellae bacterium]|nr:response regulator transcription factor [Kiritimatiellia bacterium]
MSRIKILVADDHTIVRIGLTALLSTQKDIAVVGEAKNGDEAVDKALRLNPDIVVIDLIMPHKDGVGAITELKEKKPNVKIIALTSFGTSDDISHALDAGADGAVLKTDDDNELITAVRTVIGGKRFISPQILQMLKQSPPVPILTERQQYIVSYIARGLTNNDIAEALGISPTVVREHITTILAKVGAANRAEAVAIALRKHLVKL